MSGIRDPETQLLAKLAASLAGEYDAERRAWEGSPFAWILSCPPARKGAIGGRLVERWCQRRGLEVAKCPGTEADRLIEGMRFEIKLSTLWREGVYWFQQLRDQDYEAVICLGISPFAAHCWVISKATILEQWERAGGLTPQHKGKEGVDTRKLTVDPAAPPDWLVPLGGTLSQGLAALRRIVDRPRT